MRPTVLLPKLFFVIMLLGTAAIPGVAGAVPTTAYDTPQQGQITLTVDLTADQHAISPYIYGMNAYGLSAADFAALSAELRLPVQRWGGNITTRYNWQNDLANHGSDFFFENIPEDNPDPAAGNAADHFMMRGIAAGAASLITIPMIGWVAKDQATPGPAYDCGFSIIKYAYTPAPLYPGGEATDTFNPSSAHCGTGKRTNGTFVTGNDPADTSIAVGPPFMQAWVQQLVARFGTAAAGGVRFYALDNEPGLWFETHRDVHPDHAGYDELRDLGYQYAAAIKAADQTAQILGPVQDGWTRYFYAAYGEYPDAIAQQDRDAHDGMPFVEWYLQEMRAYEQVNGVRLLDYFDLHYYPQASGVALSPAGDATTRALRLRSTRSLWDPTYVDESYIAETEEGNVAVQLIPRMRAWVNQFYPGTKLAISEYNWGALDHINGALAQADVLGIFGREGLDFATLWQPPLPAQPGAFAFRMYRNYDGAGSAFGETSVRATSSEQGLLSIYAARRSSDSALTLIIINKSTTAQNATVHLTGAPFGENAAVYRYSAANPGAIVRQSDLAIQGSAFSTVFPAESIILVVVPTQAGGGQYRGFLPLVVR